MLCLHICQQKAGSKACPVPVAPQESVLYKAAMNQPCRVDSPSLGHICSNSGCLSRTELEDTAPPRQLMETKRIASALAAYVTRMPPQLPVLFDLLAAFPYKTQVSLSLHLLLIPDAMNHAAAAAAVSALAGMSVRTLLWTCLISSTFYDRGTWQYSIQVRTRDYGQC